MNRAIFLLVLLATAGLSQSPFYLKDKDLVVFYGDSITDQRQYTTLTETFIVTRFPKLDVKFVHSGWGGDRVSGGGGGTIQERLQRDVFAYKPTVMTVMLGMNDARYRAFDQTIFDEYAMGYEKIVDQAKAAGVRMTLIIPSPFDDVTMPPTMEGGYNGVLLRYGQFLKELAAKKGVDTADLNTGVVAALKKAQSTDAATARKMIPDRVHPDWAGHLLMAAELLKAWNAPAEVTTVEIDAAASRVAKQNNTAVTGWSTISGGYRWMQRDEVLPMPLPNSQPPTLLAVKSSDFVDRLNRQMLTIKGLAGGSYELKIDGVAIGKFDAVQLASGVNLAALPTPMMKQAEAVHAMTLKRSTIHNVRWRSIEVPLAKDSLGHYSALLTQMDELDEELRVRQRAAAQPATHQYELVKAN